MMEVRRSTNHDKVIVSRLLFCSTQISTVLSIPHQLLLVAVHSSSVMVMVLTHTGTLMVLTQRT